MEETKNKLLLPDKEKFIKIFTSEKQLLKDLSSKIKLEKAIPNDSNLKQHDSFVEYYCKVIDTSKKEGNFTLENIEYRFTGLLS